MDDWMDEQMDDRTDGWNDASRRPLLYVIINVDDAHYCGGLLINLTIVNHKPTLLTHNLWMNNHTCVMVTKMCLFVFRIILEYSSFKGFCGLETRWDDSSKFCYKKRLTFIFWHFMFFATSSNVHPAPSEWVCHQFIIHKTKYETTFFKNDYGTHRTQKFI